MVHSPPKAGGGAMPSCLIMAVMLPILFFYSWFIEPFKSKNKEKQ